MLIFSAYVVFLVFAAAGWLVTVAGELRARRT